MESTGIAPKMVLDVVGGQAKETVEGDGDLALVAKGFVSGLRGGVMEFALPLEHMLLPDIRGEISVARPLKALSTVTSARRVRCGSGHHAAKFIIDRWHFLVAERAGHDWEGMVKGN